MADIKNNITTSFKVDISNLKAGITEANRQIKLANAEFKATASSLDFMANSADGIKAKLDSLNKVLENQEKILSAYEKQLELTVKEQGAGSKAADDLRIKIANQKAAINDTKKQINDYNAKLDDAEKEMKDGAKAADDLADNVEDVGKEAENTANGGFTVLKGALADLVSKGIQAAARAMKEFAKEIVEVGMSFDTQMSKVAAISGATADEVGLLREKAKEMGATTKYTARESAEAFEYMAMAGWKTEDMLSGIDGIMNLAAAAGAELGTTSDIVTDALTAFGYSAKDASHFADILAATATNSNTNVEKMGASFKYVAPLCGSLGYSAEDAAIALGLMANAGIKADTAGTSLRNVLQRMASPTKQSANAMTMLGLSLYDADGKMYSLMEIMQQLRKGMGQVNIPLADFNELCEQLDAQLESGEIKEKEYNKQLEELAERAFGAEKAEQAKAAAMLGGARALSGLLAITNATQEDFDALTEAIYGSEGAAKEMANIMLDNLGGDMTLLKSRLEGVQLAMYEKLEPSLRSGVGVLNKLVDAFSWIVDHSSAVAGGIKVIATAIGTYAAMTTVITVMEKGWKALTIVTKAQAAAQWLLNTAMSANPMGLIVAAIAALIAAFGVLWNNCEEFREFWLNLWETIKETTATTIEAIGSFFSLAWDAAKTAWENAKIFFPELWENIKAAFGNVGDWFSEHFGGAWDKIKEIFGGVGEWFRGIFEGARDIIAGIWESVTEIVKAPINFLIKGLNKFIDQLNKIQIPDWVPGIGGYGIDIPKINELERGGVLKRGQIGFLEGNGAEAVVPLENNAAWINATARAMKQALQTEGVMTSNNAAASTAQNITFNQYNTSPKALSRLDIYRATQNQLNFAKGAL